jgi:hypothetical protein
MGPMRWAFALCLVGLVVYAALIYVGCGYLVTAAKGL